MQVFLGAPLYVGSDFTLRFHLVQLEGWNDDFSPQLGPARCALCPNILRGVLFRCQQRDCQESPRLSQTDYICEECFRKRKHRQEHLIKVYKHCILDEIVLPQISRKLCQCSNVARFDSNGSYTALYPIEPKAKHRWDGDQNRARCRLFQLPALVRDAKHEGLETTLESRKRVNAVTQDAIGKFKQSIRPGKSRMHAAGERLEEHPDADIPFLSKNINSKFPFGNTHVALMVGPLIIENGVEQ